MNINLCIRSYGLAKASRKSSESVSAYAYHRKGKTIGFVTEDLASGVERTALLKSAAYQLIVDDCPKHLIEEAQLLKVLDYLCWNTRPSLMLIYRKSVLGLAAEYLYSSHRDKMSSSLELLDGFEEAVGDRPNAVISFVAPNEFFRYFTRVGVPEHGVLCHLDSHVAVKHLHDSYQYSTASMTLPSVGVASCMPAVSWGVDL